MFCSQSALVEGRQTFNAPLIANEVIASLLKSNNSGLLCNMNIFRGISSCVLRKMGFGDKWIGWILLCFTIVNHSVLINGSSMGFFRSSWGLGPSFSIFILVAMEALSCLIN